MHTDFAARINWRLVIQRLETPKYHDSIKLSVDIYLVSHFGYAILKKDSYYAFPIIRIRTRLGVIGDQILHRTDNFLQIVSNKKLYQAKKLGKCFHLN